MSATTTQLLSSGEFCNLLKVHLQRFLSIPISKKCQNLSCDTLVANERYDTKNSRVPSQEMGNSETTEPSEMTINKHL
jgi:hypothetical protein